ncbi:hypothetical protein ED208_10050 [Stagnimonas aquatica]|uniref:Uncharacterized protein n=1 Tax=Stagnimonas aquatica TaxID=2689987 RepID=A0A3N0V9L4_9GAMM|nr:hypothetical protein [Stagnimonas aquatica]ROH89473.1 hypothetical protein ED208_10050 [Stagnimonas aquatica]
MLRYLFILDVAIAVLGASMVIGVGVSALLLGWYLDTAPEYRDQVFTLVELTLVYLSATVAAGLAAWGLRRQRSWHWLAQAALLLAGFGSYLVSITSLSAQ